MRFRETGHFAKAFREASGAGKCRMRRKSTAPKHVKLTTHDIAALREGAAHPDGVMRPVRKSNFDKPEKRMAKLVAAGLATPSPFNDWYITDKGRAALQPLT